jgi:hypothetical protein
MFTCGPALFLCAIKIKNKPEMKKVTVTLAFFVLACAGKSFAQTTPVKPAADTTAKSTAKKPLLASATNESAAKPKPKPKPKPAPAPKPSGGGTDYYLQIDGVQGESSDHK